jgi:hypothetical protein
MKESKSPGEVREMRSSNEKKSGLLNQGMILDLSGGSGGREMENKKLNHKASFVPRVHSNHFDSLLDC